MTPRLTDSRHCYDRGDCETPPHGFQEAAQNGVGCQGTPWGRGRPRYCRRPRIGQSPVAAAAAGGAVEVVASSMLTAPFSLLLPYLVFT